ncbi:MAG: MATE family efflux transporter [Candidatus Aphodomonas sp.]|nr:MATE family efflux transporter [Candidatus Aphodomonas sp.]
MKKLLKLVLPSVLSQVCMFLFTIVDGIFVGNGVGATALGAVNIVLPYILILSALYMLVAVGGATVTAIRFGRGDKEGANLAFLHAFAAIFAVSVVLTVVGVCFTRQLGYLLGANEAYIDYVTDYTFWYSVFIIPAGLSILLQFFGRNDGASMLVMVSTAVCSALNIFLDWLFVFPMQMALKGAAIATGISQTVGFLMLLSHFVLKKGDLRIRRFRPDAKLFRKILMRGAPESIAQFASPVSILCLNYVMLRMIGEIAVNAFSVIGYIASFSVAVFYGVSEGAQPLIGNAYGEKNESDLKFYFRVSLLIAFVGSLLLYLLFLIVSPNICRLFGLDAETLAFTVQKLPKYAINFVFMSLNTILSAYLYSTKRTGAAVTLNLLRSFVFTVSVILILPTLFGAELIWYTAAVYEALSLLAALLLVRATEKNGVVFH